MPRMDQTQQPRGTTASSYSETPAQREGWNKLADWVEDQLAEGTLIEGDTFRVKGYVQSMGLDEGDRFFTKKIKDRQTGAEKSTTYTQAVAVIDDRRFTDAGVLLPLPRKELGTSFFDGRMRDGSRGIARGAMYHLHLATKFEEPPKELVDNRGAWDTDDYTGPANACLLVVDFAGWEPEGSQYHDSRASLKVFLNRFERDPEARKTQPATSAQRRRRVEAEIEGNAVEEAAMNIVSGLTGDDFDDAPPPPRGGSGRSAGRSTTTASTAGSGGGTEPNPTGRKRAASAGAAAGDSATAASTGTGSGSDPALQKATERQVKFIYAIAREAGLDELELTQWCQELYGDDVVSNLNRRDASSLIESLQRRRNEVA